MCVVLLCCQENELGVLSWSFAANHMNTGSYTFHKVERGQLFESEKCSKLECN